MSKLIFFLFLIICSGCTTSNKEKSLYSIGIGISSGAMLGSSRPKYKSQNAVMYGASIGLIAAVASLYLFDDQKEIDRLESENRMFSKELSKITYGSAYPTNEELSSGKNLFESDVPTDLKKLIVPGKWKLFKTSRWIQDEFDESTWIHINKVFEVKLPNIKGEGE